MEKRVLPKEEHEWSLLYDNRKVLLLQQTQSRV
jgi:hypothetical protein